MRRPCTIIHPRPERSGAKPPARPERNVAKPPVHPERSVAKSKDALFVLATVLMVAALAGCGGSGAKTAALPAPMNIEALPQGSMLQEPRTLRPGETLTVQDADGMRTTITCPADGEACDLTSGPDGAIQYTGGAPTVVTVRYTAIELPEGELMLTEGVTTILAGTSRRLTDGFDTRTELMCPEDGPDCVVTLTEDGGAESTGGAPRVVTYTTLYLPSGHTLAGDTTVPAGGTLPIGGYNRGRSYELACSSDGEDCEVTFGEYDFESTGGMLYVNVAAGNQMIWQANNGPDGTSNGAHARNFKAMLQPGGSNVNTGGFGAGPANAPIRSNTIPISGGHRTVTPTVSWASTDAEPTLGLTISATGTGSFSVDEDSVVPDLGTVGTGWNGVALRKTTPGGGGRTHWAVLYSNREKQPEGGNADNFYLTFGAWLTIPDDPAVAPNQYNMGMFANGYSPVGLTKVQMTSLSGSATYRGPATGLYSIGTHSGSGASRVVESAEVGSFTATAQFRINYGVGAGIDNATITDFRENGEPLGDWRINLLATSSSPTSNRSSMLGTGITGQADAHRRLLGSYRVQPYRNSTSGLPGLAMGAFTANTSNNRDDSIHIFGVFGAELQP